MWVRFNKSIAGNKKHAEVWIENEAQAEGMVNSKHVVETIGPSGPAFGEAPPEDVVVYKKRRGYGKKDS